jgi:cytochrome c oxidase assembly protein subunit 15
MLSKSQFFFMRNASVLKTVSKSCTSNFTLGGGAAAAAAAASNANKSRLLLGKSQGGLLSSSSSALKRLYNARPLSTSSAARNSIVLKSTAGQEAAAAAAKAKPTRKRTLLNSNKWVGYWLIGTSGLVFGIVVLGGLTRLTESGLSITEWKPVTGSIPPLTQQDWEEEFDKYKASPEFKLLNSHITLEEFKFIFFMEWGHRLWGRAIGVVMLLPAAYFALSRKTSSRVNKRMVGLIALLGLQGAIGWWMVRSGLDEEQLEERRSKPTVSQYRLTTHLGAAFLLYVGMLWTGIEIIRENKWVKDPKAALELFQKLDNPALRPLRQISLGLMALTFITAMSGGMVAGLDAGLIYNTFPHMGDDYIPSKRELFDDTYARAQDKSDKFWRNMLENPTTVQLNHRIFAMTTFTAMLATHLYANKLKMFTPRAVNKSLHAMMGFVTLQVSLGIFTLLYLVPIPLASAHQAGAVALLTSSLVFASSLRKPRSSMRILVSGLYAQQLKQAKHGSSKVLSEVSKLAK